MKEHKNEGISFFEKNLTLWVILCMIAGVLIGKFLPAIPATLAKFEYAKVSIPIAVLLRAIHRPTKVFSMNERRYL